MLDLKRRIATLETASASTRPVLIYQGDTPAEWEAANELASRARGPVIFVSPQDFAL